MHPVDEIDIGKAPGAVLDVDPAAGLSPVAVGRVVRKAHIGLGLHDHAAADPLRGAVRQAAAQQPFGQGDAVGLVGLKGQLFHGHVWFAPPPPFFFSFWPLQPLQRLLVQGVFGSVVGPGHLLDGSVQGQALLHQCLYLGQQVHLEFGLLLLPAAADDQHKLAPGRILGVMLHRAGQGGAEALLVKLGDLPAQGDGPVAPAVQHILQGAQQLVRRLVKHHGALFRLHLVEMLPAVFGGGGQKALEGEPPAGHAGDAQRSHHRAAAGDGCHLNAVSGAQVHQVGARVGNGGSPRVGDDGAAFAPQNALHDVLPFCAAVVLKIGDLGLFDLEFIQQLCAHAGVLRGNEIHRLQCFHRPGRKIPQIADGCCHHIQFTRFSLVSHTIPP